MKHFDGAVHAVVVTLAEEKEKIDLTGRSAKASISDIHAVLGKHDALIVHFSSSMELVGGSHDSPGYPQDLENVLGGRTQGGLSCSTVKPGDRFGGFNSNATGCIGVVLRPNTDLSVSDVVDGDAGTTTNSTLERTGRTEADTGRDALEQSIKCRPHNAWNEWTVCDFEPIGIFAAPPFEVRSSQEIDGLSSSMGDGSVPAPDYLELSSVVRQFHPWPVYGFSGNSIVRFSESGDATEVAHNSLYPI